MPNSITNNKNSNSSKLTLKVSTNKIGNTIDSLKDIMSPSNQSYIHVNTESSKFRNPGNRNRNFVGSAKINNLLYKVDR